MSTANLALSIVVALYFEEDCIAEFIRQIRLQLDDISVTYELVFVDDGSLDRTIEIVTGYAEIDPRIKLIQLSRNYGKEVAITAGIEHASGNYIMVMDPDLQDPPEQILNFMRKLDEGFDLVFGIREQYSNTLLNSLFSRLFWTVLNKLTNLNIPKNLSVMRIFNRQFAEAFQRYPERVRFIEGVFMHIGMRRTTLTIPHRPRFAGHSKFNFVRRVKLAFNGILAFSDRPLKVSIVLGLFMCLTSGFFALYAIMEKLFFDVGLSGWTSMITAIVFFGGVQVAMLGIIGLYIGRIYTEAKARPLYTLQRKVNL